MKKKEVVFGACAAMTPAFAAKMAQCAAGFEAEVFIENATAKLSVDSLIGILAMDLRKGMRVTVRADGADEGDAVESVCALLREEA